jgi:CRISPR-associated protein Csx16
MTKTYFITRHAGAKEWAEQQGFNAEIIEHFMPEIVMEDGDIILGTLPIPIVARVCELGGRYFHLVLDIPAELRGVEMIADKMRELGATLEEFVVKRP